MRRISTLSQRTGLLLWHVKLIVRAAHFMHNLNHQEDRDCSSPPKGYTKEGKTRPLVSAEQALSLSKRLELLIDTWLEGEYLILCLMLFYIISLSVSSYTILELTSSGRGP